jgi:hypothetical protein
MVLALYEFLRSDLSTWAMVQKSERHCDVFDTYPFGFCLVLVRPRHQFMKAAVTPR